MRRLTVVQLLPALESGGVERSTLEIADALVRAGHRAIVVSAGGRLVPQLQALGAEHVALDIGRKSLLTLRHVAYAARAVRARTRRHRACALAPAGLARLARRCGACARRDRPRFVTTVHGLNSPSRYSAIMTRGERVICVSETVRDYVLRHYPRRDAGKLRVIPRGIDPAAFPRARASRSRCACVGRRAASRARRRRPAAAVARTRHAPEGACRCADAAGARCARDGLDARLWLPGAREAGREAYIAELEARGRARSASPMRSPSPPPTDADRRAPTPPATWCCSCRASPKSFGRTVVEALVGRAPGAGLGARRRRRTAARSCSRRARWRRSTPTRCNAPRATLLAHPPPPPATIPHTLRAMQEATLAVYAELCD